MRFTVITSVLNGGPALKTTVDSVLCQTYRDVEQIIQDGGSTDGAADFLRGLHDDRVRFFQENDTGIYDAWNKAVAKAGGDWAIFLGAGDSFLGPTVLERCAAHLQDASDHMTFAYGDMLMGKNGRPAQRVRRSMRTVYSMMSTDMGFPFPATFIRVHTLKELGFDPSFRIAGDYDFAARAIMRGNVMRLPLEVTFMRDGGVSGDDKWTSLLREERRRVAEARIIPKAEEIVRGCVAHLDESACCGARKAIRLKERLWPYCAAADAHSRQERKDSCSKNQA